MMAVVTPALALQYLAELEPALAAIAIVGPDGQTLAGDRTLTARAGGVLVACGAGHTVMARVRPGALVELVRWDLEAVARALG